MRPLLVLAGLLLSVGPVAAQLDLEPTFPAARGTAKSFADVATVTARFDPPKAKPGERVTLLLTVAPKPDSYTYPAAKDKGGMSNIGFGKKGDVILVGDLENPPGAEPKAPEKGETGLIYRNAATWKIVAIVAPTASPGEKEIVLDLTRIQACDESSCLNLNNPTAAFEVLAGEAVPVPAEFRAAVDAALEPPSTPTPAVAAKAGAGRKDPLSTADYQAGLDTLKSSITFENGVSATSASGGGGSLVALLLAAAFWGYVSLVTPCVFPMIPITVSLFLKQSHQSTAEVLKLASVYCLTIIVVLGASAIFLLAAFQELSTAPITNLLLGGLFVIFALSLFGMYDITLPGFLLRFTEKRRGAGGLIGTVFGALAFSIVSFTCVAPFLGGFAGMTASGNFAQWQLILAGVVFAAAFASPFFVLALFPSLLKKMPRSGGWLDTVKAVMGFLELAAAFKFFRTAELRLTETPQYFTYDLSLAAWVAISAAAGLYLLNLFRLPHDDEQPNIGVTRLMFGLAFLSLAVYLTPALFKPADGDRPRPAGTVYAWVNAFLLPEPEASGNTDLATAVADARQAKLAGTADKPLIFVDFTGVTCTNCKLNEEEVFPMPEVRELLDQYTVVSMYTDEVPAKYYTVAPARTDRVAEALANVQFQEDVFGTRQLPLYVILEPLASGKVRVLDVYAEGKINDVGQFVSFLREPLESK